MPLIPHSTYQPSSLLFNGHLETIVPGLFRVVRGVSFIRERIFTPDDDFLDVDWVRNSSKKLVIISHGLEGSSDRPYMMGMAKIFANNGYDVLAWNFRGCGGEINRQLRFYHSGATEDLGTVVRHANNFDYSEISLIGFSLGGNLTLKYLGELGDDHIDKKIKRAVVYSVPLHLHGSSQEIGKPHNILYARRFLRHLRKKIKQKAVQMPTKLGIEPLSDILTITEFDDQYTAPIHGYKDALDYYTKCSSIHFINAIKIPTLIVNALNDSFLSEECYPFEMIKELDFVYLETPTRGGHCGFPSSNHHGYYWSERRALEFVQQNITEMMNT